jgi:transcriptional regulator with XRE-family HTH domain
MPNRRELTAREKAIAARAKSLWQAKKQIERVTQTDANKALGWTTSVFGQYINGTMPIGMEALVKLAQYLNVSPYELDPDIAKDFTTPPEDMVELEESLKLLSEKEINRLIRELSSRLPPQDLVSLVEILLDRIRNRL